MPYGMPAGSYIFTVNVNGTGLKNLGKGKNAAWLPVPSQLPTFNPQITNFTLADTFNGFSNTENTTVVKQNTLWIRVTNTGQSSFNPSPSSGLCTLQVVLKKTDGTQERQQLYATEPLPTLQPGESRNVMVGKLSFLSVVYDGELEISFIPAPGLNVPVSTPVSYTHLDVYKRQGLARPNKRS